VNEGEEIEEKSFKTLRGLFILSTSSSFAMGGSESAVRRVFRLGALNTEISFKDTI